MIFLRNTYTFHELRDTVEQPRVSLLKLHNFDQYAAREMMCLKRTYQIETPPEPAMDWEIYQQMMVSGWDELLNRNPGPTEKEVQRFLEEYPAMVPGAFNLMGNRSGHYPWLCGLISQPILPSYNYHVPDFMWLALNSEVVEPVLIEIEEPGKSWFTKSGQPTATLTQALNQISQWKVWFNEPHNVEAFKAFYGLNYAMLDGRDFKPSYLLVYGRREEANRSPYITKLRSHLLLPPDVKIMTYDRLAPDRNADQLVCMNVRKSDGKVIFETISVPATVKWSPSLAKERSQLTGLEFAIDSNKHISQTRKTFLKSRLPYWNEWSKTSDRGIISSADAE